MVVKNLESLVLSGMIVVNGEVCGMVRSGSKMAGAWTPAPKSYPGSPEQPFEHLANPIESRRTFVESFDDKSIATRAGRLEGLAGVLVSRSLANAAGWTISQRWSATEGERRIAVGIRVRPSLGGTKMSAKSACLRSPNLSRLSIANGTSPAWLGSADAGEGAKRGRKLPARGTPSVSTRGISALGHRPSAAGL